MLHFPAQNSTTNMSSMSSYSSLATARLHATLFVDENYDASHQLWRQRFVGVDGPTLKVQPPGLVAPLEDTEGQFADGKNGGKNLIPK